MEDCLSRLPALTSTGLVEDESSGASANFSKLRLTDDALLNNRLSHLSFFRQNMFKGNLIIIIIHVSDEAKPGHNQSLGI